MKFVIDRFEGDAVILEDEGMNMICVSKILVDESAKEGSCVIYNGERYVRDESCYNQEISDKKRINDKFSRLKRK